MIGAAGSSTGRFPNGSMVRAAVGGAGVIPSPDRLSVSPLYRLTQFVFIGFTWMMVAVVASVALAVWRGAHVRGVAAANGLIAVLLVLGGISVRGSGALAAGTGALSWIATIAFIAWVLHLAAVFWMRRVTV